MGVNQDPQQAPMPHHSCVPILGSSEGILRASGDWAYHEVSENS